MPKFFTQIFECFYNSANGAIEEGLPYYTPPHREPNRGQQQTSHNNNQSFKAFESGKRIEHRHKQKSSQGHELLSAKRERERLNNFYLEKEEADSKSSFAKRHSRRLYSLEHWLVKVKKLTIHMIVNDL